MTHHTPRLNRPTSTRRADVRRAVRGVGRRRSAHRGHLARRVGVQEPAIAGDSRRSGLGEPRGRCDADHGCIGAARRGGRHGYHRCGRAAHPGRSRRHGRRAGLRHPTGCKLDKRELRLGDTGPAVTCLQQALIANGYLSGSASGQFDNATFSAVNKLQTDKDLFVDGLVGRETGLALDVWPDEASLVVHTPAPAPGAMDLLGYPLSAVAASGPDAPPLPANSGSGKRVVYDRSGQRVWAVDKNERVIRSWLVAGSKYNNEVPGTHKVFSRSEVSTAWNGKAFLPRMIRWLKTDIGNIGFHGIPRHVEDGSRYMKDSELGQRLSGGCQRQADADAAFMWDFAQVGTTVVVL